MGMRIRSKFRGWIRGMAVVTSLLVGGAGLWGQGERDIGVVEVEGGLQAIPVRVTAATAELHQLANQAFAVHGGYRRVTSGQAFDVRFTQTGPEQVQVEVTRRGGGVVLNQVLAGNGARNALLKAADAVVRATSNRPGFFGSQLTFINERSGRPEVYTGDLFAGQVRQITRDNALAVTPRWSPDGTRILYTSYFQSGYPDIFQIDLRTMQRTAFVSLKGTNTGARFSPDGSMVAMVLSGAGNPEIYISNAQGRAIRRLTRSAAVEASPVFSPDGRQVVFTSDAAGGPQLYVMPVEGGAARRLPTQISGNCSEPDWSVGEPNKIAFTAAFAGRFQIAVYDLAARQPAKQVSNAPFDAIEPVWLADGRHLIYTARAANSRSLWILDTETKRSTRITPEAMGPVSQASVLPPR